MKRRPFNYHGRRAIGKIPVKNDDGINPDLSLISSIDGMEVRWIMLIEIHSNYDTKKTADFRHVDSSYHTLSYSKLPRPPLETPVASQPDDRNPSSATSQFPEILNLTAYPCTRLSFPSQYRSRRANFWVLPVAVFGSASTKSTAFGVLKCAIRAATEIDYLLLRRRHVGRRTTTARGTSPHWNPALQSQRLPGRRDACKSHLRSPLTKYSLRPR